MNIDRLMRLFIVDPSVENQELLVRTASRLGSWRSMMEAGVPWNVIYDNLHLFLPVLGPEERIGYEEDLIAQGVHPDFVRRRGVTFRHYLRVSDDWYPNWPQDFVSFSIAFTGPHPIPQDPLAADVMYMTASGSDDFLMQMWFSQDTDNSFAIPSEDLVSDAENVVRELNSFLFGHAKSVTKRLFEEVGFERQ